MHAPAEVPAYLTDRCCLTCGFRGRELQGRRGSERLTCPQCRQDLYARPARTYAEMEGLVAGEPTGAIGTVDDVAMTPGRRRMTLLRFAGTLIGRVGVLLARKGAGRVSTRRGTPARR